MGCVAKFVDCIGPGLLDLGKFGVRRAENARQRQHDFSIANVSVDTTNAVFHPGASGIVAGPVGILVVCIGEKVLRVDRKAKVGLGQVDKVVGHFGILDNEFVFVVGVYPIDERIHIAKLAVGVLKFLNFSQK